MVRDRVQIRVIDFDLEFGPGGNVEHLQAHDVQVADLYAMLDRGPLFYRNLEGRSATHAMVGRDGRGVRSTLHSEQHRKMAYGLRSLAGGVVWLTESSNRRASMMNRKEMRALAEEIDKLKDSGHELDGFERVEAKVAKNPGAYVRLHMTGEAISAISIAANEAGEDVNEFMLKAALARVDEVTSKRKSKKKASA